MTIKYLGLCLMLLILPASLQAQDSLIKIDRDFRITQEMLDTYRLEHLKRDSITIHRVWAEYDIGTALVTYYNNSNWIYKRVAIHCTALDKNKKPISTNYRTFAEWKGDGPMLPGFQGIIEVPVSLHGIEMASMSCWVGQKEK